MMSKILRNKVLVDKGEPPIPIYSVAGLEKRKSSGGKWSNEETEAFYEGVSQYSKLGFNSNMWRAILGDVKYGPILKDRNISSLNNKYVDDKKRAKNATVKVGGSAIAKKVSAAVNNKKKDKISAAVNNKKKGEEGGSSIEKITGSAIDKEVSAAVNNKKNGEEGGSIEKITGSAIDKEVSAAVNNKKNGEEGGSSIEKFTGSAIDKEFSAAVNNKKNGEEGGSSIEKITGSASAAVNNKKKGEEGGSTIEKKVEKVTEELPTSEQVKESLTIKEIYALVKSVVTNVVQIEIKNNEDSLVDRVVAQVVDRLVPIIKDWLKDIGNLPNN